MKAVVWLSLHIFYVTIINMTFIINAIHWNQLSVSLKEQ